ncbi:MAG: hypothetical protein PHZ26_02395 [Candidatus Gracilibacteria bacterium]|nr:hypothetical protein [Candidatus Gracilibacteria bacterium]MDD2908583.1 hypothetical protein [Candidatus Gracilibacteria bacterium]
MTNNKSFISIGGKEFPYKGHFSWVQAQRQERRKILEEKGLDPFAVACDNISRAMKNPEVQNRVLQRLINTLNTK